MVGGLHHLMDGVEFSFQSFFGFFYGGQLTWADLMAFQMCDFTDWLVGAGQIDQWPKLSALRRRIAETPAIADWIRRRPETPY